MISRRKDGDGKIHLVLKRRRRQGSRLTAQAERIGVTIKIDNDGILRSQCDMIESLPDQPPEELPRENGVVRGRSTFTPTMSMLDDHERVALHKNVMIATLVVALVLVWLTVTAANREQKIAVLDPVGGFTQGPVEPLVSSKGYFLITSINATQAAMQRSSVGFDLKEMLPIYFSARARKTLDEDLGHRIEDIKRRRLTLKPVIDRITPPQEAGDGRAVRVTGRLQITGLTNGRIFYDEPPYELVLLYRRNSDMSNRAAMPWVADEVEIAVGGNEIGSKKAKRI